MAYSLDNTEFSVGQEGNRELGGNGYNASPAVVRMVQPRFADPVMHTDTEENVGAQTEEVFRNYVYQSYRNDTMREELSDLTPVPELLNFTSTPLSPAAEIGRHLARIGDDLNERYASEFDIMISQLGLAENIENAYEAFANIGRRVFAQGISWGRIMMLLAFGYRLAITKLRRSATQFTSFLGRIILFLCQFMVSERIAKWIADHGGWRAALTYIPSASSNLFYVVPGLAVLSVFAVLMYNRFWI